MILLDSFALSKYDTSGMHKIYGRWAKLAQESYESKIDVVDLRAIDHIVFAGMGGSGAIGDIFSSILSNTNIHVYVVKGYVLPKTADSKTLVVTTSISGNTAETLAILESAYMKRTAKQLPFHLVGECKSSVQKIISKTEVFSKYILLGHHFLSFCMVY